jgi:hypothetical protein
MESAVSNKTKLAQCAVVRVMLLVSVAGQIFLFAEIMLALDTFILHFEGTCRVELIMQVL